MERLGYNTKQLSIDKTMDYRSILSNIEHIRAIQPPNHLSCWVGARKASDSTAWDGEGIDEADNRRVHSQSACAKSSEEVDDVEGVQVPFDHEAAGPALPTVIDTHVLSSCAVKVLLGKYGILLNEEPNAKQGGEGVTERQDTNCTDETATNVYCQCLCCRACNPKLDLRDE